MKMTNSREIIAQQLELIAEAKAVIEQQRGKLKLAKSKQKVLNRGAVTFKLSNKRIVYDDFHTGYQALTTARLTEVTPEVSLEAVYESGKTSIVAYKELDNTSSPAKAAVYVTSFGRPYYTVDQHKQQLLAKKA